MRLAPWLLGSQVADRWQVPPCVAACCAAICLQTAASLTLDDCFSLFNLPEGLREHKDMVVFIELGMVALASLFNANTSSIVVPSSTASTARTAASDMQLAALSARLHNLPRSVRFALLNACKLNYAGILALLSSNDQIADSEDALAIALSRNLKFRIPGTFSSMEEKVLKDQLRFQHMSHAFVGLELPGLTSLSLDLQQQSHLLYLRGLPQYASTPEKLRLASVPAAWYKAPRQACAPKTEILQLMLNIPVSALSKHFKALVHLRSGGAVPAGIHGPLVVFQGTSWRLSLASPTDEKLLWLVVLPTFASPRNAARTSIFAECMCGSDMGSGFSKEVSRGAWMGVNGVCVGKCPGDATELAWWKSHIVDGYVRFTATVTL